MYLAEIHGKLSRNNENKEDILTSNVFSFFKYADRNAFLYHFLLELGLQITPKDAQEAEFRFWPQFKDRNRTEPDLVILVDEYYLLVEAKYFSGFSEETTTLEHQLVREFKGGINEANYLNKKFFLLAVTAHYFQIPEITQSVPPEYLRYFKWINWNQIALSIYQSLEFTPNIPDETRLFAEDLYQLLLRKNLRNYEGIHVLSEITGLVPIDDHIFYEASTSNYRGDFIGFSHLFELTEEVIKAPKAIFFAASTADYRGDFIGFLDVFTEQKPLANNPPIIFYGEMPLFFQSLALQQEQLVDFSDGIFLKRRNT